MCACVSVRVRAHLVPEEDDNQCSVNVTQDDPDKNHDEVLEQRRAIGVPGEEDLTAEGAKETEQNLVKCSRPLDNTSCQSHVNAQIHYVTLTYSHKCTNTSCHVKPFTRLSQKRAAQIKVLKFRFHLKKTKQNKKNKQTLNSHLINLDQHQADPRKSGSHFLFKSLSQMSHFSHNDLRLEHKHDKL